LTHKKVLLAHSLYLNLNNAADTIGNMMDYAVNDCELDGDSFLQMFITSGLELYKKFADKYTKWEREAESRFNKFKANEEGHSRMLAHRMRLEAMGNTALFHNGICSEARLYLAVNSHIAICE